ncbi:Ig-like domain-containing protein [Bacillus sp. ISL-46]|uniref:Ig-like domain-containing protein n=1 Tax=Bacillus sp. ISL-46 TaxID=2819129 RepID=UPI001BE615A1|nr:Ig-like domain-containing protein [Bacillus sp. ISL-46]MBT2720062.1 Ig-like domain-containing protein [Bacillus sp. ISL-46]
MVENGTAYFEGVIRPTNKLITWSSNNTKVATVDSKGNVKAIKAGSAVITATTKDGVKKASFGVTVK